MSPSELDDNKKNYIAVSLGKKVWGFTDYDLALVYSWLGELDTKNYDRFYAEVAKNKSITLNTIRKEIDNIKGTYIASQKNHALDILERVYKLISDIDSKGLRKPFLQGKIPLNTIKMNDKRMFSDFEIDALRDCYKNYRTLLRFALYENVRLSLHAFSMKLWLRTLNDRVITHTPA